MEWNGGHIPVCRFPKKNEDKIIHKPITIVAMAEERGLLQKRLEEVLKQEGNKDHVDKAKDKWSPAMEALIPKTEQKTITIDDIRRRAQNATRRRKGNLLKDIPSDELASNGQPGLFGYRWKLLIPRDYWRDQEWEAFQAPCQIWINRPKTNQMMSQNLRSQQPGRSGGPFS